MIAIVSHVDRTDAAWRLANVVDSSFIAVDDGTIGAGYNHRNAWKYVHENSNSGWGIVLEDDALPVPNFRTQLWEALEKAPSPVVSLYLGRARPPAWQPGIMRTFGDLAVDGNDPNWLMAPTLLHHVGVAMKSSLIPLMLDYVPWKMRGGAAIDEAIGMWCQRMHIQVAYSTPSLLDHDHTLPTLIQNRTSMLMHVLSGAGDTGERPTDDPSQVRRAWKVGERKRWDTTYYPITFV
jgi:hypothetical protein